MMNVTLRHMLILAKYGMVPICNDTKYVLYLFLFC